MTRSVVGSCLLSMLFLSSACASTGALSQTGPGVLVNAQVEGEEIENDADSTRKGKACTHNLLGLFVWGNASVPAAKRDAGIDQVSSVNRHYIRILTLYGQYCLRVVGSSSQSTDRNYRERKRKRTTPERSKDTAQKERAAGEEGDAQSSKESQSDVTNERTEGPAAIKGSMSRYRSWTSWIQAQSGKQIIVETTDGRIIEGELFGIKASKLTVKTKDGNYKELSGGDIELLKLAD